MLEVKIGRPCVGECGGPFHTCGSDDHCGRSPWNDCEPSNWSGTIGYVLPEADFGGLAVESGGTSVEDGSFGRLGIGRT